MPSTLRDTGRSEAGLISFVNAAYNEEARSAARSGNVPASPESAFVIHRGDTRVIRAGRTTARRGQVSGPRSSPSLDGLRRRRFHGAPPEQVHSPVGVVAGGVIQAVV